MSHAAVSLYNNSGRGVGERGEGDEEGWMRKRIQCILGFHGLECSGEG